MKLHTRLYVGFGSKLLLLVLFMGFVIYLLTDLNKSMEEVVKDRYEYVKLATGIRDEFSTIDRILMNMVVQSDHKEIEAQLDQINKSKEIVTMDLKELGEIIAIERVRELHTKLVNLHKEYMNIQIQVVQLVKGGEQIQATQLMLGEALLTREQLFSTIDEIKLIEDQLMGNYFQSFHSTYKLSQKMVYASVIIFLLLGFTITFFTVKSTTKRLQRVSDVIISMDPKQAETHTRIQVNTEDAVGDIANAFNNMVEVLKLYVKKEKDLKNSLYEKVWLEEKGSEITSMYQGVHELKTLATLFMSKLTPIVGGSYGVFYTKVDNEDILAKLASYAESGEGVGIHPIRFGEGLVGQCALDNKVILLENIPKDYITIKSGLGLGAPRNIILLPIAFEGKVTAVVELAAFQPFSESQLHLLEKVKDNLGITLNSIRHQMQIKQLLEESQTLAEELQVQSEELLSQQEELKSMNEELEVQNRKAEQKTKELEELQYKLEEKARLVEQSSTYKSEFLANMSHELRTPLNSLLILSSLLAENKDENLTKSQVDYATTITSSGHELLELINEILDLSKIESGKIDIHPEEMVLEDLGSSIQQTFLPMAQKNKVDFTVHIERGIFHSIYIDEVKVKQIVKNLLSNAFKFTKNGSISFTIKRSKNSKEDTIAFIVSDTGIGIPKDKQTLIFEAFQQADGTTSRNYGGTGLGLSICKELAHLLGGWIELESEEGIGSTFTFYLPILNRKQDSTSAVDWTEKEAAVGLDRLIEDTIEEEQQEDSFVCSPFDNRETFLLGKKVLIVDDDMRNVFALTTALEEKDMTVLFAENGEEGLRILQENKDIDLVLMDIMMPVMDGYETIRMIRKMEEYSSLPIIAITAKAMKQDRDKCFDCGASDYITKPVNLDQLFSCMLVWLY